MLAWFRHNGVDWSWFNCFRNGIAAYKAQVGVEQRRQAALARWKPKKRPSEAHKITFRIAMTALSHKGQAPIARPALAIAACL